MVLFVNPLTPRVKPWVIQSFLTFDSMKRTLKCDHLLESFEQYFTVLLYVFQFYPVCNFGKFINFGLSTARNERFNQACSVETYSHRFLHNHNSPKCLPHKTALTLSSCDCVHLAEQRYRSLFRGS